MTCPLCNDTGEQRYWEGRWRDEKAENVQLRSALEEIAQDPTGISIVQAEIAKAALGHQQGRKILKVGDLPRETVQGLEEVLTQQSRQDP